MADQDSSMFVVPSGEVDFTMPPVAEVALAVYFAEDQARTSAILGAFWYSYLRDIYPISADMPLAGTQLDTFDLSGDVIPNGAFPNFAIAPVIGSRIWCLTSDQTMVVQLQRDRIVLNWRKLGTEVYPHYPQLRTELERIVKLLETYGSAFNLWPIAITQTEVTYINQVERRVLPPEGLLGVVPMTWPAWLGKPESLQLQQTFTSKAPDNSPARLYLTIAPGEGDSVQLNLTCKSRPSSDDFAQALGALDSTHRRIVHAFKEVISPELRKAWGSS